METSGKQISLDFKESAEYLQSVICIMHYADPYPQKNFELQSSIQY